jgi:hypothetical protein
MDARTTDSIVPLLINLKGLERPSACAVDSSVIRDYVLRSLNRVNSRDVEEFLESEFDNGLRNGTWLFLFDSFDEIPEILSSVDADASVRLYAEAIADFLRGMNQCRGIVASRQFRGPRQLGWPRFRIVPLTEQRRLDLIDRAAMRKDLQQEFLLRLATAPDDIRSMVSNPMYLSLLVEYVRSGNTFPSNAHAVYERYVESRLTRDADRVRRKYRLEPERLREMAERVAFCISADSRLGLTPLRDHLRASLRRFDWAVPEDFDSRLDALEYIKLARSEAMNLGEPSPFTFSHRRFQEYFATCVVLREPERVSPTQLLTDGRWREAAVVICQTRNLDALPPILEGVRAPMGEMEPNALSSVAPGSTNADGKGATEDLVSASAV